MVSIYELVTAQNFADFVVKTNANAAPLLGETLFPARKQIGLNLSYLKGRGGLPVVLKASAFDANAPIRDRIGVTAVQMEMPFFRERYNIREIDRQNINTLLAGNQTEQANNVIRFVFDDAKRLVDGAGASLERMRMQLLSTGTVTINSEGANHSYDYGIDAAKQKVTLTLTDRWSDPSSTPVTDLLAWQDQVETNTGVKPGRAIMNKKTFALIANNITIRQDLNPLGAANIILTDDDVVTYLSRKTGMQIAIYNKMFVDEAGVTHTYFPDNTVTLLPEGNLGYTNFGTTPEESDLLNNSNVADVAIVNVGMAITTYREVHPVSSVTQNSMIALPSFEQADNIFIATVA